MVTPRASRRSTLLRALRNEDTGFGIVEVVVAIMVFTVAVLGLAYSMATMTKLTYESSNRETASNLAAAEIDRIGSLPDVFNVHSDSKTQTVDGIVYTINSSVGWVSTSGSTGSCGTGGGNLQYKRVNVTVTWPGMIYATVVRADSALAPDSRINDPAYGTILVSVNGLPGQPSTNVAVTVTPVTGGGGQTITDTIDPTDTDGCTFVLKVAPGTYDIKIAKSGYIEYTNGTTTPTMSAVAVAAGSTFSAQFTYAAASNFTLKYAANSTLNPALPSNLETTFVGPTSITNKVTTGTSTNIQLFPYVSGYQAIAGDFATTAGTGCKNVDPEQWLETDTLNAGDRVPPVQTAPGASGILQIPMGIVTVKTAAAGTIQAVQQSTGPTGDPGCASPTTYTFAASLTNGATSTIALPYGTWKLYTKSGSVLTAVSSITVVGGVVQIDSSGALVGGLLGGNSVVSAGTVTLDPRLAK